MQVVDASAVLDLLLRTPRGERVHALLDRDDVWAPQLVEVEVCSALARLERAGKVSPERLTRAYDSWRTFPYTAVSLSALRDRAWLLRDSVRVVDAFYVAAAVTLGAPLLTSDARLARSPVKGAAILLAQ
ncbi:type II toxin-antitoxin system VapC family toxin [Speluncibacter jeojiensis]|uniref:Ribonuclease VapC n=1 Tax=Speluncibacter jeojiensis TaxID=2710754 RepID=A0A9X4M4U0_9ACTN|nr:type II toxin-antitoxin system VapC family toxin [Corynebacteriales bacterium D3-21]